MKLTSPAYKDGEPIPARYTCEGQDISPEYSWSDAPNETKSFVLVLHDPDAPKEGGFLHWLVYDIPANVSRVAENAQLSGIAKQGRNDSGKVGYVGPCPPSGRHRYFAHLYALNSELGLPEGASHSDVIVAMESKVVGEAEAELMGTYEKQGRQVA